MEEQQQEMLVVSILLSISVCKLCVISLFKRIRVPSWEKKRFVYGALSGDAVVLFVVRVFKSEEEKRRFLSSILLATNEIIYLFHRKIYIFVTFSWSEIEPTE